MLDSQLIGAGTAALSDVLLAAFHELSGILAYQCFQHWNLLGSVLYYLHLAEQDDAFKRRREIFLGDIILAYDAEGNVAVFAETVVLVTLGSAMEIDFSVFIDKIDRNGIRIAVFAEDSQCAVGGSC